jgi:phytoene desaturase
MYRLVAVLEKLARDVGAEIHTSTKVERILHNGNAVNGVQVNGESLSADYVLCGADAVVAHKDLVEGFPRRRKKMNRLEPSLSGMVFLWGVRKRNPQLATHNILFSRDYRREFENLFARLRPPDDPTVYIAISSRHDPSHAPADGENWFVLLNMPYLREGQDWQEETERMREAVFRRLKGVGIDIARAIEAEKVYTPEDFGTLYASNRGSIYGVSSNSMMSAFRRPPNRSRDLRGLYFAGGATHPGGGIPLVVLSGKIAAELIAEADEERNK